MSLGLRRTLPSLLILFGISLPARAEHGVYDEAHLFSKEKASDAEGIIDELRRVTHKDLLIETFTSKQLIAELSLGERKEDLGKMSDAERVRFFKEQARKRAKHWQVNGVYVLLCARSKVEEPDQGLARWLGKLKSSLTQRELVGRAVIVWPPAGEPGSNEDYFPAEKQTELDQKIRPVLAIDETADTTKDKKTDKAKDTNQDELLQGIVDFVGDALKTRARELNGPPAETFRWTQVLWAAAVLCGAWLVLGLLRGRVAARQEAAGTPAGANQPFAAMYGTSGLMSLFESWRAPAAPVEAPSPAPATDQLPAEAPMHPDDKDALAQPPGPFPDEEPEAAS
jgi:hypothetical protein